METWATFSGTDLALAAVGLIGFASVVITLATATSRVTDREIERKMKKIK